MSYRGDITGERYDALVAVKPVSKKKTGETKWLWQCDCGNTVIRTKNSVTRSSYASCGCRPKINCRNCGKEFMPLRSNSFFCSARCGNSYRRRMNDDIPMESRKKDENIDAILRKARKVGMSYGQLQARRYMEEN